MPVTSIASGTRTLATADGEWSLLTNDAEVSPNAFTGVVQVHLDTSGLAIGNYLRVRFYNVVEALGATQVLYDMILSRGQGTISLPATMVLRGFDATMQLTDGDSAFIRWDVTLIE